MQGKTRRVQNVSKGCYFLFPALLAAAKT